MACSPRYGRKSSSELPMRGNKDSYAKQGPDGPLFFLKDLNLVPIACQEAPMNRILLIVLLLSVASGLSAEEQVLKPTTDIFAGMALPAAQIAAEPAATPTPKKLTAEELAERERHQQAARAASSAASTLYTEQTVTTIPSAAISTLQLYSQDELITWIGQHKHLQRVVADQ